MTQHGEGQEPDDGDTSTEETVRRAARGDSDAFNALFRQYNPCVLRAALRVLRRHEDAEDVSQTVWSKLVIHLGKYKHDARFTTWLHRIATNAAIDLLRKRRHQHESAPEAASDDPSAHSPGVEPTVAPGQELALVQGRIGEELTAALDVLRETHEMRALCFELFYIHEMSIEEIASTQQLSEGTVKSHLFLCRKYLAREHPVLADLYRMLQEEVGRSASAVPQSTTRRRTEE